MPLDIIRNNAKTEVDGFKDVVIGHKLASQIFLPVLMMLWVGLSREAGANWIIFWSVLIPAAMLQVYFFISHSKHKYVTETFFEVDEALRDRDRLLNELRRLDYLETTYLGWLVMERKYNVLQSTMLCDFQDAMSDLFSAVIGERNGLFGMSTNEVWTFSVFLHHNSDDELFCVWREKSKNHPSKKEARSWKRGVGHAGKVFAERDFDIEDDPDNVTKKSAPQRREYDPAVYKCMVGAPIGSVNIQGDCLGVLCATSSVEDRFDEANSYVLRNLASIVGNILLNSNFDKNGLVDEYRSMQKQGPDRDS